jgi:hypothetical protein
MTSHSTLLSIIRLSLEISLASGSSPQTCLSLCLVASWTRKLALPHLFSTIILIHSSAVLILNPDPEERKQFVRNVWCRRNWPKAILACTRLCPGMANLSIAARDFELVIMKVVHQAMDAISFHPQPDYFPDVAIPSPVCILRELHFPIFYETGFSHSWMRSPPWVILRILAYKLSAGS